MIKIIVHAFIDKSEAVVEVVFASKDETIIRDKMAIFQKQFPKDYLAIYDLPLDTDLTNLTHYPSVAISKDDFH
ncbi:phosphoribosylaminoimidazole carboxylase [Streptococcus sp. FT1-106]|uniref:phosphoribosylaminoimidazole carboxylase n=1 Tax=unclassified Streptococcus TaxID=2608887 RepID=UPI003BF57D34